MDQILSQNEVEALLSAVQSGEVDAEASKAAEPTPEEAVDKYDFLNPDKVIRGRLPGLDAIYSNFAKAFAASLGSLLRRPTEIQVDSVGTMKFAEFINYLPIPACLNLVYLRPLTGISVISFETKLVLSMLDLFFGSDKITNVKLEGRDFSKIEQRVIQKILRGLLKDLEIAFAPAIDMETEYIRTEMNPQFAAVVSTSDIVLNATFEMEIEGVKGKVNIVIPYVSVEPFKQQLSTVVNLSDNTGNVLWQENLVQGIQKSEVDLVVNLGKKMMSVRELLAMTAGDVISMPNGPADDLLLEIQNVPKAICRPLVQKSHLAIQIEQFIQQDG